MKSKPFAKPAAPPPALEAAPDAELAAKFLTARMVYQKLLDLDQES